MKRAFVDTSAWFSYSFAKDPDHKMIREALEAWEGRLVTSNFIFDEAVTLARSRMGHAVARELGEVLRDEGTVELLRLLPEDEEDAWSWFKNHHDKAYSYTDCTSFAMMRRLRLPNAITLDRHFHQAGFKVYPAL